MDATQDAPHEERQLDAAAPLVDLVPTGAIEKGWEKAQDGVGLALKLVALSLEAAPFGGPVADLLTCIYNAACQASKVIY